MNHRRAGLIARSPELDLYDPRDGLRVTTCVPSLPSDTVTSTLSAGWVYRGATARVFDVYTMVVTMFPTIKVIPTSRPAGGPKLFVPSGSRPEPEGGRP
jgi:hypothetical protein